MSNYNRNLYMVRAKQILRRMSQLEKDPQKKQDLNDALDQIDRGIYSYEQWIQDAKMIGVRNPSFDGDMVGWLDDDFDDDDDEDKKNTAK